MAIIAGVYRVSGLGAGVCAGVLGLLPGGPVIPLNFTLAVGGAVPADLEFAPQSCQAENDNIRLTAYVVDQDGNPVSLRSASALAINVRTPKGTVLERPASLLTSGVDGALQYTTVEADLEEGGVYQLQAAFTISGKRQTTRWGRFRVGANIE